MKKFINFECLFPANDAVLKKIFQEKLDSVLREYSCTGSKDLIIDSIFEIENLLNAFETPRDIVRFFNVFTFAMDCIERNGMMDEINVADLFAISIIHYLNINLYRLFRDDDSSLLTYDDYTKSLRISPSYKSVFEDPMFAEIAKGTNPEEEDISIAEINDVIADVFVQKQTIFRYVICFLFEQERKDINGYSMRYPDSYFRYFAFTKKRTQILRAEVLAIFSPTYKGQYEIRIRDIIRFGQESSFIHNIDKWYNEFDDSKIEILKKLSLFVSLLCELKPEIVDTNQIMSKAQIVESFMETYDIHRLLNKIYYNKLNSISSGSVGQEETEKKYEKDRDDFGEYIRSCKYEVNFISLVLGKIRIRREHSLLGKKNIEKWSKQIIDNFVVALKKCDREQTFFRNTLYTISHVAALDTDYWINSFKDYVLASPYFMDWIARVVSYKNNNFEWNEPLKEQLHLPNLGNRGIWGQIAANSIHCEDPIVKDFAKILSKDLKSLDRSSHPYLKYVEDYWKSNDMYK